VVSIPLIAQTKILGAINVASRSEASPSEEALAVAAAIGQQIGVAIDNARLYAQTVRYARDREAARLAAEQARAAAEAANSAKSDFLANVSHELRTPLASILGFARLVRKRLEERVLPALPSEDTRAQKMTDQVEENLEIIIEEGQRLMLLINNLLDLEKIEAGMMEWRIQPTSMAEVIQKATSATASLFEGKALSLILDVPPDLPLVNGDPDKLLQVVINMISNAVKFSSSGSVTVRACRGDNELVVEVADQGIGISLMDQAFLFEKFTQVGDPIKGKPKGTGLGLAISREIIERHGGRIWVNSQPGQGSTFSFALPLDAGEETSEPSFVQNQPIQDI
jgi:signal transduction histidine kinase